MNEAATNIGALKRGQPPSHLRNLILTGGPGGLKEVLGDLSFINLVLNRDGVQVAR